MTFWDSCQAFPGPVTPSEFFQISIYYSWELLTYVAEKNQNINT